MSDHRLLLLVVAFTLNLAAAQPPPAREGDTGSYRIAGAIVDGISSQPLAKVRVSIVPSGRSGKESVMITGPDGRFSFRELPPGKWTLRARRERYGTQIYGQAPLWNAVGVAVVTGPETKTEELVFRLHPAAVVTGTVTDEFGEPVVNALVQLFASYTRGGWRRVIPIRSSWSSMTGEYRIWGLPTGAYYAAVVANPWFASQLQPQGGDRLAGMGFEPQFFPGTSDATRAAPFRMQPGQERRIDFRLRFSKAVRLAVHSPNHEGSLMLMAPGPQGSWLIVQRSAVGSPHMFAGVLPGRYRLSSIGSTVDDAPRTQEIEVGTTDAEIALALPKPVPVTVSVKAPDAGQDALRKLQVAFRSDERGSGQLRMVTPGDKIAFSGLTPGRYQLTVFGARNRLYLDSVIARGAHMDRPFVDLVDDQPAHFDLLLKNDGGLVNGDVKVAGHPAPGIGVILAPREPNADFSAYGHFYTDLDGSFEFTGLKPGEYLLFTSTDPELEYMDRVAMRAYYESATPVHVEPRSSQTIQIDLPQDPASQPAR